MPAAPYGRWRGELWELYFRSLETSLFYKNILRTIGQSIPKKKWAILLYSALIGSN